MEKPITNRPRTAWHPLFIAAIHLELKPYLDSLEIKSEEQLTTEPLKIDCVIIKKPKDVMIKKNFAANFREINIFEYKSPDDHLSISSYKKVHGYAWIYAYLNNIPIEDITISFVYSHVPKKLFKYLHKDIGYTIKKIQRGVHYIANDVLPIQFIDNRKLFMEDNLWLKGLSKKLDQSILLKMGDKSELYKDYPMMYTYLEGITRANIRAVEEAKNMETISDTNPLVEVWTKMGLIAEWDAKREAKVKALNTLDIAQNMLNLGFSPETVASATMLDLEKVKNLSAPATS
ncbi:MAG: hypothetical protein FWG77_02510 [Treponema sp.]|nr:hypothetical protein [Treponema sp.]